MKHRVRIEIVEWTDSWNHVAKTFDIDDAETVAPVMSTVGFFVYENREVLVLAMDFRGGRPDKPVYRTEIGIPKVTIRRRIAVDRVVDVSWSDD